MRRRAIAWVGFLLPALACALEAPPPSGSTFALVIDRRLYTMVGRWTPENGWQEGTHFYTPPNPEDTVVLVDMQGRAGTARIREAVRPDPAGVPLGWNASISSWTAHGEPFALALLGGWSGRAAMAREQPLSDPEAVEAAATVLKSAGLRVAQPLLTQNWEVELRPGHVYTLAAAHNDLSQVTDADPADLYSVAFLKERGPHEALPLFVYAARKIARRDREQQDRLSGPRPFVRFLALPDLDGDGAADIALYIAHSNRKGATVKVFTFDGRRPRERISSYRAADL